PIFILITLLPLFIGEAISSDPLRAVSTWFLIFALAYITSIFASMVNIAAFAVIVEQLLTAPLSTIDLDSVFTNLKKRLGVSAAAPLRSYLTLLAKMSMIAFRAVGVVGIRFSNQIFSPTYFIIALIEGKEGRAAVARLKELMGRLRHTVMAVHLFGILFVLAPTAQLIFSIYG